MTARPTISVIIPTFNCARYLPAAVQSVREQTLPVHEIIIVDDGSVDETPAVVAAFGIPVVSLRQAHEGIGAARNRGVDAAAGDYLAFLDADDLFTPAKCARQFEHLVQAGGPDISFGLIEEFVSPDLPAAAQQRLKARVGALAGSVAGTMMINRSAFARVGPFATAWRLGEFADWYLRAADAGLRSEMLPEVVLRRRLHGDNVGIRERASRVDYVRIMKSALDRRRHGSGGPST